MIKFYGACWRCHQHLPKSFKITTGDEILRLVTEGLGQVASANFAGSTIGERGRAADELQNLRLNLEKIRAFLTLAWERKFINNQIMHDLNDRLDGLGRQATRWRDWFLKKTGA